MSNIDEQSSSTSSDQSEEEFGKLRFLDEDQISRIAGEKGDFSLKILIFAFIVILTEIMFQDDIFVYEMYIITEIRNSYFDQYYLELV